MNCTVYPDKVYQRVAGTLALVVLAGAWYTVQRFLHGDRIFEGFLGLMALVVVGSLVSSFFWGKEPWYQAGDDGIRARKQLKGTVPWSDVTDVERLPRREHHGDATTVYLKEGWRPVMLTIREPGKHLDGFRRWLQPAVPGSTETTGVRLEFTGLQPLSKEFYDVVEHHLAKHAREARRAGAKRT